METYNEWHIAKGEKKLQLYYQAVKLLVWEKVLDDKSNYAVYVNEQWIVLDLFSLKSGFLYGYRSVASDNYWPHTEINNFKEYFDMSGPVLNIIKRPNIVHDKRISDLIISYAIRLDEFFGIACNAKEIINQFDVVPTKYGPAVLTDLNEEEIRYTTKALKFLLNEDERCDLSNLYIQSKYVNMFKYVDEMKIYHENDITTSS